MKGISVHILFATVKWKNAFPRLKKKIGEAAAAAFDAAEKPPAFRNRAVEVSILLTTDAEIRRLNRDFRGKDQATNVLSFPQPAPSPALREKDREGLPLGDIALAFQTTVREAREQGKVFENHVLHLVIHGTLHLLGYDHMHEKEARAMERAESDILRSLGYPDPYASSHPTKETDPKPHGR